MISAADYFGPHRESADVTAEREMNAATLLENVNRLLREAESAGVPLQMNPHTHSLISGTRYGGFRPQDCPEGAPHSAHKEGQAVDIYDPQGDLDRWLTDLILTKYNLFREAPQCTEGWTHLASRAPASGRRTFLP